jgi:hypothetical protein
MTDKKKKVIPKLPDKYNDETKRMRDDKVGAYEKCRKMCQRKRHLN